MKTLLSLVLLFGLVSSCAYALETSENFFAINQEYPGLSTYRECLKADPVWSVKAKEFLDFYSPDTYPYVLDSEQTGIGGDEFFTCLSIPEDIKLVSSEGYVAEGEVCAGDKLRVQKGVNRGEFWQSGGDMDSPPIYWVPDVRELAYSLLKTKLDAYKEGRPLYPDKPFRVLFKAPRSLTVYVPPDMYDYYFNDSGTIVTSKEQQERFREYLKEMGYDNIYEDLQNAEYVIEPDELSSDVLNVKLYKISIKKEGKELGFIREIVPYIKNNLSDQVLWNVTTFLNDTSGIVVEVIIGGQEMAHWPVIDASINNESYNEPELLVYAEDVTHRNGELDPLTGIPIYRYYNQGWGANYVDVGLACSLRETDSNVNGLVKDNTGQYTVTGNDSAEYAVNHDVECTYYFYGLGTQINQSFANLSLSKKGTPLFYTTPFYTSIQMPSVRNVGEYKMEDLFTIGRIVVDKSFKIVQPAKPQVEISVAGSDTINIGELDTLRILVKNTGDTKISLKSVYPKPSGKLISCDTETLAPSQQAECLLSVTPVQSQGLSVEVSYDYKSCGKSQVGLVTKTLIDSKTVRPVLKEQSYLMGVHGACDNSYYSCYSASEGSLFAGYKCFKTANGFYAPATERFNMRFDVSEVPKNAEILGAKLYLKASEVEGKQSINVYSVDKIPEVVKCLPGGDICTKPYCGECTPLYDIDGAVASSAEISTAGQYSFDVTNHVKEKLAGDGIVSLQIRSAEGLWESLGQSSCTVENEWDKRDVSFDAGGRDGPYMEVVYK